jgi:hypothetical protein
VRPVGSVFFPLDEELGLLPGELTPSLVESLVRLGTWLPFLPAAGMLAHFTRVGVGATTARRLTEYAGAAYEAVQMAAVEALERDLPAPPQGPAVQLLSVDGAMVPLVGGEWAEVKTLAVGVVQEPVVNRRGEHEIHTTELSYFSRLTDHETFGRLATVETHHRGTETAGVVCAVVDGAEWEQGFSALHRPDAVRILDWAHAVDYLDVAAQAAYGAGSVRAETWLAQQRQALTHDDPQTVLAALRVLRAEVPSGEQGAEASAPGAVITHSLEYLEKRRAQIQYAPFAAQGYPVGSGSVESATKLVVEARLKGAGMRWARAHVNPLVALRTVACSDRWAEAWPQITAQWRAQVRTRRRERATARRQAAAAAAPQVEPAPPPATAAPSTAPAPHPTAPAPRPPASVAPPPARRGPRCPAADHPWRHAPIGRARCA